MSQHLTLRRWDEAIWLAEGERWQALLKASGCDPLFLSWQWQTLWWRHFSKSIGGELCLYAGYSGSELVGLAPFYLSSAKRRCIPVRSAQLIGSSWLKSEPAFSEYLDVIALPTFAHQFRRQVLEQIQRAHEPNEIVVGNTRKATTWLDILSDLPARSHYMRRVDELISYQADLTDGMQPYLKWLGASTRRALWHKRHRLEETGSVKLEVVERANTRSAFEDLNRLRALRWGEPVFNGEVMDFHEAFASGLAADAELMITRLWVGDRLASVLYDAVKGTTQYNIQLGFDPAFLHGASLGLLHFGYALEQAVARGITRYDFLAGTGKTSNYKKHLAQHCSELISLQTLIGQPVTQLYRLYDWWSR